MFNKFELIGAGASVFFMALAIYLVQAESILTANQPLLPASEPEQPGVVVVGQSANVTESRADALMMAMNNNGKLEDMVIDDIKIGIGEEVKAGDVVSVHYIGTLQNGQEFDNSRKRGEPFEFKVGAGQVIQGWDKGLLGMKAGGQRILVIPPEMAYGDQGVGPIPGKATLVFAIELLGIK